MKTGRKGKGRAAQAAGQKQKPQGKTASSGSARGTKTSQRKSGPAVTLTHEKIAQRAEHIWRQTGCLPGHDEQNWHEAEAQLKAELGAR